MKEALQKNYEIVYNLENYQNFSFLASAYITTRNEANELTYIQRKVGAETMENYRDDFHPVHKKLLKITDDLQISALEKKFNVKTLEICKHKNCSRNFHA